MPVTQRPLTIALLRVAHRFTAAEDTVVELMVDVSQPSEALCEVSAYIKETYSSDGRVDLLQALQNFQIYSEAEVVRGITAPRPRPSSTAGAFKTRIPAQRLPAFVPPTSATRP